MAASAGRGARRQWDTAHERWQEQQARHASRRRRQSVALRHLHEPFPEALASDETRRGVSRARRLLCRRLRHPQPWTRGRGSDLDEGGDDETWADTQRGENLGEGCPAGLLRLSWLYAGTTPSSQRWPLVSGREPVQEERAADQDENRRAADAEQQGRVAGSANAIEPPSRWLVLVLTLWRLCLGV